MARKKTTRKSVSKAVVLQKEKPTAIDLSQPDGLIQSAITAGAGVEQLEKLLELKYRHEEREAAKNYHAAFCAMQAAMPAIPKTKEVRSKGQLLYRYAPLEAIIETVKPYLKEYGFSYHWSESFERDGYKRITCHITGHGHSESAYTDVPIMSATAVTNKAQQAGSASTYGKRYSLSGILGIMVDDDDDGRGTAPKGKKPSYKLTDDYTVTEKEVPEKFHGMKLGELKYNDIVGIFKILPDCNFKWALSDYGKARFSIKSGDKSDVSSPSTSDEIPV